MDRFRAAIDELVDKMKEAMNGEPKSPVEILLDQYLSLDDEAMSFSPKNCTAVAIPTAVMNDFSARTKNIVDYPFIMERIWEILVDYQHDPNLMKKSLNLLHHFLINGAIQVLKDCQDAPRMTFIESIAQDYNRYEFEQYQFSQHLDVGAGVRKTAAEIHHLLVNERELLEARRKAEHLHRKLSDRGLRGSASCSSFSSTSSGISGHSSGSGSPPNDIRPARYTDHLPFATPADDIGLQIVTHPDELFEQEVKRSAATRQGFVRAEPYRDNIVEDDNLLKDPPPQFRRGSTSRAGSNRTPTQASEEGTTIRSQQSQSEGHTTKKLTTESVDLLDLDMFGPPPPAPSLAAAASLSSPRTQSSRMPPRQFSATI